MAEKRSDYSDGHQPKQDAGSDPLAELARLIGQNDPFHDVGRAAAAKPLDTMRSGDRPAPEWLARQTPADDYDPQPASRDAYRADPRHQQQDDHQPDAAPRDDRYEHDRSGERYAAHGDADYEQDARYDDRYRVAPPAAGDYDGDQYYAEDGHIPPGEEGAPPRRRGGMFLTIAAVIGLAVIGTAGAFAYRALTSGPGGSANPPVIKADTTPAKIVPPAPASADAQGKPFQERIGTTATERVLPREEQPVSLPVPPQPRPNAPQTAFAPSGGAGLVAPPPPTSPGALDAPKRVRTQTIRPDTANDATAMAQPPAGSARAPAAGTKQGGGPMTIAPQSEQPPRTKTAARTPAGGAFTVQLSSQKTEAEAEASYRAMQSKYPSVLGGREPIIRRAEIGQEIRYRVRLGSFATYDQAVSFCKSLTDVGGQCLPVRN